MAKKWANSQNATQNPVLFKNVLENLQQTITDRASLNVGGDEIVDMIMGQRSFTQGNS